MPSKKLNELGQEIFKTRYAYPGEKTWADRAKVIARTMASCEKEQDIEKVEKKFYDAVASGDLIPGGRIIYGAGRLANKGGHNLLNCYVIIPNDSVESIGKTIQDMYKISCAGGGIGFNFSEIRPKGDDIQNIANSAPGAVSVMRMVNEIGNHVRAGKNRRTALMAILDVTHPDLIEFLHVKLDKNELINFNISVGITDRFIEACENDEEWYFTYNNRKYYQYSVSNEHGDLVKVVALNEEDAIARANTHNRIAWDRPYDRADIFELKARDIWEGIWSNAVKSGDPGIFNVSLANKLTNVSYFEELKSTNPCGEVSIPSYGNCCLANINLHNMVVEEEVDWKRLARTVRAGIHFLDNVLTVNKFPTEECAEVGRNSRRIGLGVTGLHYMLIELGIKYGSEKCLEFLERLFQTIRDEAYKQSVYLSRDKSAFPAFDAKKFLSEEFALTLPPRIRMLIKQHGIRNAIMLTVPPTGTISMLMGVSTGIEPIFSAMYKRRYRDGNVWKERVVVDPLFGEYFSKGKDLENFVGAYDVDPEDHMRVQATIQRYVDNCISKTINMPAEAKAEDMTWKALDYVHDLKGLTIYRAGSKGQEPLEAIPLTEENIEKYMSELDTPEEEMQSGDACSLTGAGCG